MSVIVTLRGKADSAKLEAYAAANPDTFASVIKKAQAHGLIAHRFYTDNNGGLMVLDEWPDAQSFQAFFAESEGEIGPMMGAAGMQGAPEVSFWSEMDMPDKYGWGA
jgi:hypothetical protein